MLKDVSYFKTSTGNEPAAGPKGLITGVKKGKTYFSSWSMNVKIEGQNVVRHTDSTTHNHGSMPGNTAVWTYLDSASDKKTCERERKRVDNACGEPQQKGKEPKLRGKTEWKVKNCGILAISPKGLTKIEDKDEIAAALKEYNISEKVVDLSTEMIDNAQQMVTDGLKSAVEEIMPTKKLRRLKMLVEGASSFGDFVDSFNPFSLYEKSEQVDEYIKAIRKRATTLLDEAGEIPNKLTEIYQGINVEENISDLQSIYAQANDCTRARKCLLQSYNQSNNKGLFSKTGCCAGQTGHHLIPKSFFGTTKTVTSSSGKKSQKFFVDKSICPDYNEGKAPTVCVEGQNNSHGSHGAIHEVTDRLTNDQANSGKISYKDARDSAVAAHRAVFALSLCSAKCIKSQLDDYHTKACNGDDQTLMHKKTAGSASNGGMD